MKRVATFVIVIIAVGMFIVGILGNMFFSHYRGTLIPHPIIWHILSWVLIVCSVLLPILLISSKPAIDPKVRDRITKLKTSGQKIVVDFDRCIFRGTDYSEEVEPSIVDGKARSMDALFNQQRPVEMMETTQSTLIYCLQSGETAERFQSPVFQISETSLKARILQGQLTLYIDRFDRQNYYFEFAGSGS